MYRTFIHLRPPRLEARSQLVAAQAQHDDIGKQEMDRFRVALSDAQRLIEIPGFQDAVALGLENVTGQVADIGLVIDEQNCFHHWRPRSPAPERTGRVVTSPYGSWAPSRESGSRDLMQSFILGHPIHRRAERTS
jgi:hypothetical protein